MPISTWENLLKQVGNKSGKLKKVLKHNAKKQRKCGKTTSKCIICGNSHGLIRQYDLHICRKCFREVAEELGFINYS